MSKRMRVSPSGPFIDDPDTGTGPLEGGDGTPGYTGRFAGVAGAADILSTGAVQLFDQWRTPLDETTPTDTLPWTLFPEFLYDLELHVPAQMQAVPPTGSMLVNLTALDLLAVGTPRVTIFTVTRPLSTGGASTSIHQDISYRDSRFEPGSRYDSIQMNFQADANQIEVLADKVTLRLVSYVKGSR